ncbi:sugar transferase [Pseudooceanicola sp.]|uniref:sugar transferase n=1 Tax=Pseudooceanicola sp. TaxID=1914328 RepID=UPI00351636D1
MTYLSDFQFSGPAPTADTARASKRVKAPSFGHITLFGLPVVSASTQVVVERLLAPGRRSRVAFLNAHCGNVMARNPEYADVLHTADMVLPDGIGVELAARMGGDTIHENLNGTDFVPALLAEAGRRGLSVFLFGGRPGVAKDAADKLCLKIPGLRVVGTRDGFEGSADTGAAIAAINRARPDIVLVAMGVPQQDLWLARNARHLDARITLGVGALFDFLSGRVRRAPKIVRKVKCEWIWRLAMEPRRMAKRYLIGNFSFLARSAIHAIARTDRIAVVRRGLDLTIALTALAVLLPFFICLALAIRLDSRGPVLFRQTRIGRDGQPFEMLKFRSMYADAEAQRAALLLHSDRDGVCFKSRSDPRITRIGRIMRRFSIDELPQILNVLRGEMAVVGPRPALPEEVLAYHDRARERLEAKPGLTGIWQVSGRAEIGFEKMIDMDLAYVRSRTIVLDLMLVLLTFRAVVGGRGAY